MERIRREADRAKTERAELYAILDAALVGTFATVLDGRPWTVPMLYGRVDDRLYLHGSSGAGALRHVAAGAPANLAVTLIDGIVVADNLFNSSANYRSAVVRGNAERVWADEAYEALTLLSERLIPGRSAEVRPHTSKELAATLVLRMEIGDGNWTAKVRTGPPGEPDVDPTIWAGVVPMTTAYGTPVAAPWVAKGMPVPPSVAAYADPS
jgi:nitroimidazol reductase NimA-like FMN-containing flavoprotein (pyridoxamine 5'-phosphate oxidase superfamily)